MVKPPHCVVCHNGELGDVPAGAHTSDPLAPAAANNVNETSSSTDNAATTSAASDSTSARTSARLRSTVALAPTVAQYSVRGSPTPLNAYGI